MKSIKFWKTQSIGNDFVLVHGNDLPRDTDLAALSQKVCDRHFGIGSDGMLVLDHKNLRMFNPDGSEDFCGNGLRCATIHAYQQGWIDRSDVLVHFDIPVQVAVTGENRAHVELPPATFEPAFVPHTYQKELFQSPLEIARGTEMIVSSLSTGSTHTILFPDELPHDDTFFHISPLIENHPIFPLRTSVIWTIPVSNHHLKIRIWERGAGETLGCGTGSAAAAVAWSRRQNMGGTFDIENPGGILRIHLQDWHSNIGMESDVETVFCGEILLNSNQFAAYTTGC